MCHTRHMPFPEQKAVLHQSVRLLRIKHRRIKKSCVSKEIINSGEQKTPLLVFIFPFFLFLTHTLLSSFTPLS